MNGAKRPAGDPTGYSPLYPPRRRLAASPLLDSFSRQRQRKHTLGETEGESSVKIAVTVQK